MTTISALSFRSAIETYIRQHALPVDKYSHQPRLYALALTLAQTAQLSFMMIFCMPLFGYMI